MMDDHSSMKRRLAAILAADIAGYSRLMGEDEAATVRDLKGHQTAVLPLVGRYGGRVIDTAGDGILAEFPSVINATECAVKPLNWHGGILRVTRCYMRKIEEIEEQIQKLSREEFAELREWFLEQDWKAWDSQLEADVKAGKLDELVSEARAEYQSG